MRGADVTPIYNEAGQEFLIDTCRPQRRAVQSGKIRMHAFTHGHYPGHLIPEPCLPGLSSVGYWDAVGPQDWGLEPHRNEGIEIVMVESGVMGFRVDGNPHALRAGSLTITRPWQLHCLGDPHIGSGRLHWLILDVGVRRPNQDWRWPSWIALTPSDLGELTLKLRQTTRPAWHSTPEITGVFQSLAPCLKSGEFARHQSRLQVLINWLLVALLDALRAQATHEDPALLSRLHTVELFLRDLAENPRALAEPWTLETMARQCGIGSTSFVKHCHGLTSTSPVDYLNRCRLTHAARRLREEHATPVTRIATECGFSSGQYFATRFSALFHASPREYRAQHVAKPPSST